MAIDWSKINSGECFESLVHALLFAEDSSVVLFGRPGKDSGQDARSGSGETVYQTKFRQNNETLLSLAKKEFKKIEKYKSEQHENYKHWKNVTQWVLISNADVNPNDVGKWNEEVKPLFDNIGIAATFWSRERLMQKLIAHPQIVNVFFEGANRCFIGLKKKYDFLRAEPLGESYDVPFIRRDREIEIILDFADKVDASFYRVVGNGGVGKTRLLYEAALGLSAKGIRVLWGLPETMVRSDSWFESLNDNRKTVAILDDITDASLVKQVIEQVRATERKNWKFIFSYRLENEHLLFGQGTYKLFPDKPLEIKPLDHIQTEELVKQKFGDCKLEFIDLIYRYSAGNCGWIGMLLNYFERHDKSLQPSADEITADYVDSALRDFSDGEKESVKFLLRWLALWQVTEFDPNDPYSIRQFLKDNGVSGNIPELLAKLVKAGLVFQFGVDNRKYKVLPMMMREAVLSDWLFSTNGEGNNLEYTISEAGKDIVKRIIKKDKDKDIIFPDKILRSLTQLSLSRLKPNERFSFVSPILDKLEDALKESALYAETVKQVIDITSQIGRADLERAIDILSKVLSHKNIITSEGENPLWGHWSITYGDCIADIPWLLFTLADYFYDGNAHITGKYLKLFQELCRKEENDEKFFQSGKRPSELLRRIFRNPDTSNAVKKNAIQTIENFLTNNKLTARPFVEPILDTLLSIEKEKIGYANHTFYFERSFVLVDSDDWKMMMELREKVFSYLESYFENPYLWEILASSHLRYFRRWNRSDKQDSPYVTNGEVRRADTQDVYNQDANTTNIKKVLINDLKRAKKILKKRKPLSPAERYAARKMWNWYCNHGKDEKLKALAQECEKIKTGSGKWPFDELFFHDSVRQDQLSNVVKELKESETVEIFHQFFDELSDYIDALKSKDLMFTMTVGEIAGNLAERFDPTAPNPTPVSQFVLEIIKSNEPQKTDTQQGLKFTFAAVLLRSWIRTAKMNGTYSVDTFRKLFANGNLWKYFFAIYRDAGFIGDLTDDEINFVLQNEDNFDEELQLQFVWLLGTFANINWDMIIKKIESLLISHKSDWDKKYELLTVFINAVLDSTRGERWICQPAKIAGLIEMVATYRISGKILETSHSLYRLGKKVDYKFTLDEILAFAESRIALAKNEQRDDFFEANDILEWFDPATIESEENEQKFHQLCGLMVKHRYDAYFLSNVLPDIVFLKLDSSGDGIKKFAKDYKLTDNEEEQKRDLHEIARLISRYYYRDNYLELVKTLLTRITSMDNWTRDERIDLYSCLVPSSTGVLTTAHGEVNPYYFNEVERAAKMRQSVSDDSPMREFLDLNIRRAEENLKREQGFIEETRYGSL